MTLLQNLDRSSLFSSGIFSTRPMHFNIYITGLGQSPPEIRCKIYIMGEPSQKVGEGRGIKRAYDSERAPIYKGTKHFAFIFFCYVDSGEKRKMKERGRRGEKSKRKREGKGGREQWKEGRGEEKRELLILS